ncbi:hypothetical protein AB1N83_013323 [Pleurotus pulmonarius]
MSFYADFTRSCSSDQVVKCDRGTDCPLGGILPPGTKTHYMFSNDPSKPGRQLCESCHNYYLMKPTTRRGDGTESSHRNHLSTHPPSITPSNNHIISKSEEQKVIHKEISRAQRAEPSHPIRAIGDVTSSLPSRVSAYVVRQHLIRTRTGEKRERLAKRAYSNEGGYVGTVYAQMVYLPPGKTKPMIIHDNVVNIMEAIGNVPVHIGANELKNLLFNALKEKWDKYSKGYPLSVGDITIRFRDWTPMRTPEPDVDVILHYFQKKKGKNIVIEIKDNKKNIVYLEVPMEIYNLVLAALDEEDWIAARGMTSKPEKRGRREKPESEDWNSESASEIHENMKHRRIVEPVAPTNTPLTNARLPIDLASHVDDALQAQVPPTFRELQSLFSTQCIDVNIYPVVDRPLAELVKPGTRKHAEHLGPTRAMKILLNSDQTTKLKGAFKIALLGSQTSEPIFRSHQHGHDYPVCMKQMFFEERKEVTQSDGRVIHVKQDIPYDSQRQAQELMMEIFVTEEMAKIGPPPFPIPTLAYVEAALAIEQVDGKPGRVWLLEEVIPVSPTSPFRKYIGNASCAPIFYQDTNDHDRALFCSFAQHVQFIEMRGKAFVADFQGAAGLLTDPQIITTADGPGTQIFAAGNIHQEFARFHKCNKYCVFFNLAPFSQEASATNTTP